MKRQLTFRHMEHSNALENHVDEQLAKLEEFLKNEPTPIYLDIVLDADQRRSISRGELILKTPHYDIFVHDEQPDMYKVIDAIVDKAYKKIHEKKKEIVTKRRTNDDFKGA